MHCYRSLGWALTVTLAPYIVFAGKTLMDFFLQEITFECYILQYCKILTKML